MESRTRDTSKESSNRNAPRTFVRGAHLSVRFVLGVANRLRSLLNLANSHSARSFLTAANLVLDQLAFAKLFN